MNGITCRDLVAQLSQPPAMLALGQQTKGNCSRVSFICEAPKISIMTTKPPYYRIFLLTIWQERNRDPPAVSNWRFRLEDPRTGWRQAFADAAALLIALQAITVAGEEREEQEGGEE